MKNLNYKLISQAPNEGSVVLEINKSRETWTGGTAKASFACLVTGLTYYAGCWIYTNSQRIISREGMVKIMKAHPNELAIAHG
ncbi:hypothetical protein [Hymenobacter tenuis]